MSLHVAGARPIVVFPDLVSLCTSSLPWVMNVLSVPSRPPKALGPTDVPVPTSGPGVRLHFPGMSQSQAVWLLPPPGLRNGSLQHATSVDIFQALSV